MTDLEQAIALRTAGDLAFVLVHRGQVLASGGGNGVVELLAAVDGLGVRARGASLADKVVGKAVAVIAADAGIAAIDAGVASEAAVRFCAEHHLPLRAGTTVPTILNRRGDGTCPMEQLTQPCVDPGEGVAVLREFLAARRPAPRAAAN